MEGREISKKLFMREVLAHKGIIWRICKIYRKDKDGQDDLYQDIILNAWESYPRFEGRSKFSTWLYRVALNTALHQNRKNKFLKSWVDIEEAATIMNEEPNNDQILILLKAIYQLDSLEKGIVILYLDGLPYKEIGEVMGLTESNVGVRLNRIKSKLKVILSTYGVR